jgi:hypothetical protein
MMQVTNLFAKICDRVRRNEKLTAALLVIAAIALLYFIFRRFKWFMRLSDQHEEILKEYPHITREKFRALINAFQDAGAEVIITSAVRGMSEGNDPHSRKHAMDINVIWEGEQYGMHTAKSDWIATGLPQIAEDMGFRWGGNFHTPYKFHGTMRPGFDPVHFDTE